MLYDGVVRNSDGEENASSCRHSLCSAGVRGLDRGLPPSFIYASNPSIMLRFLSPPLQR